MLNRFALKPLALRPEPTPYACSPGDRFVVRHSGCGQSSTSRRKPRPDGLVIFLGHTRPSRDDRAAVPAGPLLPLLVYVSDAGSCRVSHLFRNSAREQRPVHADRLPASQPLGRYGHQRQLFEMMLWLVLVQERRLSVKPSANDVVHGQQLSLPTRQYAFSGVLGGCAVGDLGSDDMDLARLPGTRPQLRRDLRHILTAHP